MSDQRHLTVQIEVWANMGKRRQENRLVVEGIFYPEACLLEYTRSPLTVHRKASTKGK